MDDSAKRGWPVFGVCAGSFSGMARGGSPLRSASAVRLVRVGGRVVSLILGIAVVSLSSSLAGGRV